jgi:hypothetical protein
MGALVSRRAPAITAPQRREDELRWADLQMRNGRGVVRASSQRPRLVIVRSSARSSVGAGARGGSIQPAGNTAPGVVSGWRQRWPM